MSELSNFLVDNIMSDYTPVVVYSGRFQPFHRGHYAAYQQLVKKFGKERVYIGTSNKIAPFNYADKKLIMTKMFGIPQDHIVQVKNPYSPVEIVSKFDPTDTALVIAVGEKDENRLSGKYYKPYTDDIASGYKQQGYVYVVPKQPNPISGTDVREWMRAGADSVANFLKAYPKFDETVYKLVTQKLSEAVNMLSETTSMAVTNYYKAICNQLGVTPIPLKFGRVGYGGASTSWDSKTFKPLYISFDLSKVHDIERAVLHELAHQILLLKEKNPGHGSAFKKLESKLIDKYFYSIESKLLHEASGFGAFPHDGNATTGHYWNNDWDEFDDPEPYIGCLPGWEILPIEKNRLEQLKTGELPLNNHKDKRLKNNKLDLGIIPPQEYLTKEEIVLDVKIGDTILMGKFKNKKVVVKTIGTDEHGMPTINGKKVATFRMLKEAASISGGYNAEPGEPETSYTNAGAKRILNKTKPEPWFVRGGYKQLDTPKADWIQGKSKKNRDNDSMLRKATYNVKNMKISNLDPVTDPYTPEEWQEAIPGKKIKKDKRFWEESETEKIADELTEELGIAMGYPSAEQIAAHESELKRIRKKLDKTTTYSEPFALVGTTTEMAMPALKSIEKRADDKFDPIDIVTANKETDHFFQRLNDPRNGKEITEAELQWFFDRLAKRKVNFIEFLKKYNEFVVKDKRTNINIPFMRQANTIIAKTIMRKRDFMTNEPEYTIESLQEDLAWTGTPLEQTLKFRVPLTPKVAKALYGDISVQTFHTSDVAHIGDLKKMIGKKQVLSTFSYMSDRVLSKMHGVQTNGGIIYEVEGKLMLNSMVDTMSAPDAKGLRWIGMAVLSPHYSTYGTWMEKGLTTEFPDFFKNDPKTWTEPQKKQYISKAIEFAENYVTAHKTEILDKLKSDLFNIERSTKYTWNEVLVSNIKVRDVLVRLVPPINDDTTKEIAGKLKPIVTGTIYYTSDPKDAVKFVQDRGGFDYVQFMNRWQKGSPVGTTNYNTLTEGGVGGRVSHPFDQEMNLTFGDLKDIVKNALTGELGVTTEKTDGINSAISWIDGKLKMARNKSHLKNRGENAMDADGISEKFTGDIRDAYLFAMKDLEKAISTLSETQRTEIFENGGSFMSLEVIYPKATNVIPYGQSLLVFHNIFQYDMDGNRIGQNRGHATTLADMIQDVNQSVQEKFTIQGPPITELPKNEELSNLQPKYLAMINKLQSEFNLTDDEGLTDYHKAWWAEFIDKNAPKLPKEQKLGLVDRWALNDKNFRMTNVDPEFKEWADKIDKQDKVKILKDNSLKFEEIFLGVGADILSFMTSVLTVNPDEAKRNMVDRLQSAIKTIRAGKDPKKIEILKHELKRIQMLGGFDKIVPNEGIIFEYPIGSGKVWKLTGNFAPANRLLGLLYK